jgi:hypothetical protein
VGAPAYATGGDHDNDQMRRIKFVRAGTTSTRGCGCWDGRTRMEPGTN